MYHAMSFLTIKYLTEITVDSLTVHFTSNKKFISELKPVFYRIRFKHKSESISFNLFIKINNNINLNSIIHSSAWKLISYMRLQKICAYIYILQV